MGPGDNDALADPPNDTFNTSDSFIYTSLEGPRTIRILELHPGAHGAPILCSLSTLHLDNPTQQYEAISYAWGDPNDYRLISCNGDELRIPKSLQRALRIFRPEIGSSRFLWADSICIDQKNIEERSSQVQLMRHIYGAATKVLIWLGRCDSETVKAGLDLVCEVARKELETANKSLLASSVETIGSVTKPGYRWKGHEIGDDTAITLPSAVLDTSRLRILKTLFSCPWFMRLWVLQEVVLSQSAEVFWGRGNISFEYIGLASVHIMAHYRSEFATYTATRGVRNSRTMYSYWTKRWSKLSFYELLCLSQGFFAADSRDHVFGVLGLATKGSDSDPNGTLFMQPDYSLSKAEVYKRVATKILIDEDDVDLLCSVQHDRELEFDTDWPSWVPDWAGNSTFRPTPRLDYTGRRASGNYKAVRSTRKCTSCEQKMNQTISFYGIIVTRFQSFQVEHFDINTNSVQKDPTERLVFLIRQLRSKYDRKILAKTFTAEIGSSGGLTEGETQEKAALAEYDAFVEKNCTTPEDGEQIQPQSAWDRDHTARLAQKFDRTCRGKIRKRRFLIMEDGRLGMGPQATKEGDVVVILFGGSMPLIFRPLAESLHYRVVGECYLFGSMRGEEMLKWKESGEHANEFHLV